MIQLIQNTQEVSCLFLVDCNADTQIGLQTLGQDASRYLAP
jgi:hypothetical protein